MRASNPAHLWSGPRPFSIDFFGPSFRTEQRRDGAYDFFTCVISKKKKKKKFRRTLGQASAGDLSRILEDLESTGFAGAKATPGQKRGARLLARWRRSLGQGSGLCQFHAGRPEWSRRRKILAGGQFEADDRPLGNSLMAKKAGAPLAAATSLDRSRANSRRKKGTLFITRRESTTRDTGGIGERPIVQTIAKKAFRSRRRAGVVVCSSRPPSEEIRRIPG